MLYLPNSIRSKARIRQRFNVGLDKTPGGFTLLEMLLAVIVIALVGSTVANAISGVANQTFSLERRTVAHWVGQNQLHRLRMARREVSTPGAPPAPLPQGKDSTRVFMGERDWEIRTEITTTDHPFMRRVEIEVFELQEGERVGPYDHQIAFVGLN